MPPFAMAVVFCVVLLAAGDLFAQEVRPFEELLARPVSLKKGDDGVHPRLFFGAADIPA